MSCDAAAKPFRSAPKSTEHFLQEFLVVCFYELLPFVDCLTSVEHCLVLCLGCVFDQSMDLEI